MHVPLIIELTSATAPGGQRQQMKSIVGAVEKLMAAVR